jgi:hypothetical protein
MRETGRVPQGFHRLRKTALSGIEQPKVVPSSVRLLYGESLTKLSFCLLRLPSLVAIWALMK